MRSRKPHVVLCTALDCRQPATYKIAAEWTDGTLVELKPYGFACAEHVSDVHAAAERKRSQLRLSEGESIGTAGVFRLDTQARDSQLVHDTELEQRMGGPQA